MTEAIPHPYDDGLAAAWIARHPAAWEARLELFRAICLQASGTLVGCVSLELNRRHHRGTLGYWIGRDHWNRGICTEACREIIEVGFDTLQLNRIEAVHLSCNPASGAVLRKLGMRHEGTLRECNLTEAGYQDVEQYAMLASDHADPAL